MKGEETKAEEAGGGPAKSWGRVGKFVAFSGKLSRRAGGRHSNGLIMLILNLLPLNPKATILPQFICC